MQKAVPELFSGKYKVVTEFGRSLLLKAGTTLSKVQFIKHWIPEIHPILMVHVGANQFYTEVYLPDTRKHRFDLADEEGVQRSGEEIIFDIAGPLCFQVRLTFDSTVLILVLDPELAISRNVFISNQGAKNCLTNSMCVLHYALSF